MEKFEDPYSELRDVLTRRAKYLISYSGNPPPLDHEELDSLISTLHTNLEHWMRKAYMAGYLEHAKSQDTYEEEHDPHHNHLSDKKFYSWKDSLFEF